MPKWIVHPNMKVLSSFNHSHVIPKQYDLLSSVEYRILWKNVFFFCPCNQSKCGSVFFGPKHSSKSLLSFRNKVFNNIWL